MKMKKLILIAAALICTLIITSSKPSAAVIPETETVAPNAPDAPESADTEPEITLEEPDPQADLHETVAEWIRKIAQEHKLVPWQEATFHIEPLGPGTHGWLVHVLDQQTPIGYLIIHALEDGGFRLAEYGVGEQPIFDLETLQESLVQLGMIDSQVTLDQLCTMLIAPSEPESAPADADGVKRPLVIQRHYLYPFAAYWKVQDKEKKITAYFDAFTGEQYPLSKDPVSKSDVNINYVSTVLTALKDRMQLPKFDPYEDLGWIVEEPIRVSSIDDVIEPLRHKQRLTLTVELYDDLVLLPYPIIGYAQWEKAEAYLLIYSEGLRYVPLIDAVRYGNIYLEQEEQ
jgi:hypothetical protein